jgi:hypothetical protein
MIRITLSIALVSLRVSSVHPANNPPNDLTCGKKITRIQMSSFCTTVTVLVLSVRDFLGVLSNQSLTRLPPLDLYTGRVLTYLPTQVNRMYADLDGTGTVDALMLDPEERVVEVQDAFNGISFAGLRQSHRFNASLDDSHIPPLEAIMLSMRHAAVDHDSKEDDFRAEILTPPVAIHPEVKNRIFGEAILGDFDEMKQVSLAGVKLGSGAPAAEDRKKTTGWTTVTMDGRGEIIAVSHQGRVVFRLLTDASWRPHSEHSTVDHLPALYGFVPPVSP